MESSRSDGSEKLTPPAVSGVEQAPPISSSAPEEVWEEYRWYQEHAALIVTTVKWAFLGALAGVCTGLGTRLFLWTLSASSYATRLLDRGYFHYYYLLPLAMPACVWLIRTFAPDAKGHGTEAVIAAVHQRHGRVDAPVAPVKLVATVLTLAFGGSVGKEGPAAQIGASIASTFADVLRLDDEDRRRLVICGIGAGFAAVFGTPISGALFGIEVLYLGRIEYPVLFPCMVAGIIAHLVCGYTPPVAHVHQGFGHLSQFMVILLAIAFGALCGLAALMLIEMMRALATRLHRFERHPYLVAVCGGLVLVPLYSMFGSRYAGLGMGTITDALAGTAQIAVFAFVLKIIATSVTLEFGGSGGIVTPLFFIGSTAGVAFAHLFHLPVGVFAAFGFIGVVAAAANTPIAAAVMGMELLGGPIGVYAALCACSAYLLVGHRSVYSSQRLGLAKSAALQVTLGGPIGDVHPSEVRMRETSLSAHLLSLARRRRARMRRR